MIIAIFTALLSSCGQQADSSQEPIPEPQPEIQAPSFTPENYPVVDGSTVTIPLSEAIGAKIMGLPIEEARQYIVHYKTHQAYVNLIEGNADLIFVTGPSAGELELAAEKGVELEVIPVVSEGFVFLASSDNPVEGLTLDQIKDIYTGKITNWKDAGGEDAAVRAYQRPENSGSQTGFLELVMQGLTPMTPPIEQVTAEMGELIDAVAAYDNKPDAIGYSYYYFVTDMWGNDDVKLLRVDGVYPDKETISSGEYSLRTAYYAVIRADEPEGSASRQIIDWLLSEEGQTLAEEAGYVKIK